jgi:hypothetical protein
MYHEKDITHRVEKHADLKFHRNTFEFDKELIKIGTNNNTKEHYEFPLGILKELSRKALSPLGCVPHNLNITKSKRPLQIFLI